MFLESLFDGKKCFKLSSCSIDMLVCELVQQGVCFILVVCYSTMATNLFVRVGWTSSSSASLRGVCVD